MCFSGGSEKDCPMPPASLWWLQQHSAPLAGATGLQSLPPASQSCAPVHFCVLSFSLFQGHSLWDLKPAPAPPKITAHFETQTFIIAAQTLIPNTVTFCGSKWAYLWGDSLQLPTGWVTMESVNVCKAQEVAKIG